MGAHLLPRVGRRGDAAHRLSVRAARTAPPLDLLHRRLRDLLGTVRPLVEPRKHGDLPAGARHLRRAARALEPGHPARRLPEREARPGARHIRPRHHGGASPRTDLRRMAHRHLRLARGVLHQCADRAVRAAAGHGQPAAKRHTLPQDRLDRARPSRARGRLAANGARPGADARLVQLALHSVLYRHRRLCQRRLLHARLEQSEEHRRSVAAQGPQLPRRPARHHRLWRDVVRHHRAVCRCSPSA